MLRYFNTEGRCEPDQHYMVRLDDRLDRIKRLYVDREKYFVINRGRQYGKTTTLMELAEYLKDDYGVLALDFQMMSTGSFADEQTFVISFIKYIEAVVMAQDELMDIMDAGTFQKLTAMKDHEKISMDELFRGLSIVCKTARKPIVLMIDEVDSAANNQVFIDFLAQLRGYYLGRKNNPIFHSVILAGVYDIKNLKLKIRSEGDHQYNSPWNIAAKFNIDMSFSTGQIADMLEEYEADHRTGMDVEMIADEVYQYTSGYPYLVSAICKYLDEEVPDKKGFENPADVWTKRGVDAAVKILLNENIPLFDSMIKQLDAYRDMRDMIEQILYQGRQIPFSPAEKSINLGLMFGFLKEEGGHIAVANRIFEMYLLNMFVTEESTKSDAFRQGQSDKKKQNLNFLERRCLMITCGSIYIIVKDFDKSVQFYKLLLERDVTAQNMNRFAIFNIESLCLSIMNGYFDVENPDKVTTKGKVYEEYDDCVKIAEMKNTGKVVINLSTNDLKNEYDRICELGIGSNLTEIRYINARNPYYYFSMKDPDDNTIEITGPYDKTGGEWE